jgi:hypothetical protein
MLNPDSPNQQEHNSSNETLGTTLTKPIAPAFLKAMIIALIAGGISVLLCIAVFRISLLSDVQRVQEALDEQCGQVKVVADENGLNYDPHFSWSDGNAACYTDFSIDKLVCSCSDQPGS